MGLMVQNLKWHVNQYTATNRSTIRLGEFAARILAHEDPPTEVLEVGCGGGSKMLHLSEVFPAAHWSGVDIADEALEIGREHLDSKRFALIHGDMNELEKTFGPKRFDISFSIMTLMNLEDYERPIQQMMAVTKKWLFVLNLFSDSEVNAFVRLRGRLAGPQEGMAVNYNVYSLPRFDDFCRQHGATEIVTEPFEIDIDIPRPDHRGMGTWTERLADGRRLQRSGPLAMPWWFVAVRAPERPPAPSAGRS